MLRCDPSARVFGHRRNGARYEMNWCPVWSGTVSGMRRDPAAMQQYDGINATGDIIPSISPMHSQGSRHARTLLNEARPGRLSLSFETPRPRNNRYWADLANASAQNIIALTKGHSDLSAPLGSDLIREPRRWRRS